MAIFSDRRQLFAHLLTAPLIGLQWWLFIWAPVVDRTIDLAIGYLILPVTLVLAGVIILSESVSRLKLLAIGAALCGLLAELWFAGSISWVSAAVFLGYPPYFLLHRLFRTRSSFSSLCVESGLVMLAMLVWLSLAPGAVILPHNIATNGLLAGLGLLSLAGMICYVSASKKLPLNSFGLLSYLEPLLLLVVATVFLGEMLQPQKLLSYGCFIFAMILVCYEAVRSFSVKR
jgi:chloramphenicol-sensitive protein RarD